MLARTSITAVSRYWASVVGVPTTGGARVCDEPGTLNAVRIAEVVFARVPASIAMEVAGWPSARLCDPVSFAGLPVVVRAHASLAYADTSTIAAPGSAGATALVHDDERIGELAATMPADEWDECGLGRGDSLLGWYGAIVDGRLVAVAAYEEWDGVVAHLCVATTRAHRGHGYAQQAAAAAAQHAIRAGLVAQWRASMPNTASIAVGARLGFGALGEQLVLDVDHPL